MTEMSPYTSTDLVAASDRALAAWDRLTAVEKRAAFVHMGLITEDGKLHPDYDWTAERYEREFGRAPR